MSKPTRRRTFHVKEMGPVTIVTFSVPTLLEDEDVRETAQQPSELVEGLGRRQVVINFAAVQRLTSRMIGVLLSLSGKVRAGGGRLVLCGLRSALREIFEVMKLSDSLPAYETPEEALETFVGVRYAQASPR